MSQVFMVLDEAALLGHLDCVDSAVGIGRGYGIRLMFIFQSLGQLQKCFPDGQDQTLLSNVTNVFFAVNDTETAELVSKRLGDQTIMLESGGVSHGTSWQHSDGANAVESHGGSTTTSSNWQLQSRALLKPDEVISLPPRMAITFTPGTPPILSWLLRYYQENDLLAKARGIPNQPRRALARSLFTLVVFSVLAFILTHEIFQPPEISSSPAANRSVETQSRVPISGGGDVPGTWKKPLAAIMEAITTVVPSLSKLPAQLYSEAIKQLSHGSSEVASALNSGSAFVQYGHRSDEGNDKESPREPNFELERDTGGRED